MFPLRRAFSASASTIYALSTPPGVSAIAVVRLSGPSASSVLTDLTPGIKLPLPRLASLRHLYSPSAPKRQLDTALVDFLPSEGPRTTKDKVLTFNLNVTNKKAGADMVTVKFQSNSESLKSPVLLSAVKVSAAAPHRHAHKRA